ncbi:MAG: hypothetical protein V9H26_06895 [Verrucomicrobiota bacterium]
MRMKHLELNASEVDGESFRETPFTLSVGKRLGAGYLAQAVIVTNISDAEIEEKIRFFDSRYFTGTMVAKIPHALRRSKSQATLFCLRTVLMKKNLQLLKI